MQLRNLLAIGLLLGLSINANATLTLVNNGLGVYDSGLNATWTQDANLLTTLENTAGYDTVVNAIISAVPVIHDTPNGYDNDGSGVYKLTSRDFRSDGAVDWFAAQAYVGYLNSLNKGAGYGGSNQWALPTQPDQNYGYYITNSQFGELYYNETDSWGTTHNASYYLFSNVQSQSYWSGTEYASEADKAFVFSFGVGGQGYTYKSWFVNNFLNAWAVSPGQLSAPVSEPSLLVMFSAGLLGLLGLKRRVQA